MNGIRLATVAVAMCCVVKMTATQAAEPELPHWLWSDGERHADAAIALRGTMAVNDAVDEATLRVTADFARVSVEINDRYVMTVEPYDAPAEFEIRSWLSPGKNSIALRATGVAGPSAVAATVQVQFSSGESLSLLTDDTWSVEGDSSGVKTFGQIDARRWSDNHLAEINAFAEYNQWKEALASDGSPETAVRFSPLPQNFEIERLHTARDGEGSWVSMAFDPQGRIVIGRESKGLLRLTLPDKQEGGDTAVEVINDSLEECRGLVFRGDDLFANANRSKALYRLRDTSDDDRFDEITRLQSTEGSTGHGRNDLALGPDGKIHAIHGDVVLVPEEASRRTMPESGAPKELGHWVRTDGAGDGDWEIMTRGLRNPYGIAFNPDGEAFTYDADNEGDVGLPFYRPTRINHLVSGANYGWHQDRENTRNFQVYAPDSVPTTFDVGRGSPTAVMFGTRSHFPPIYQQALFALDWAYGRIVVVHLTPRGASYYASGETFLEGRPLNVTDLDFDEDGAMYFVTGGRKTQSALYRIRYQDEPSDLSAPSAQAQARRVFSRSARGQRVELEALHGQSEAGAIDLAWADLGNPDPWLRNAARVAVESQPVANWREQALQSKAELGGLTSLLALARAGKDEDRHRIVSRLADMDEPPRNRSELLTLLRILEWCINDGEDIDSQLVEKIERLVPGWQIPHEDAANRELCRALVLLRSPQAVELGLNRMASAEDQLERLHYVEMLSQAAAGWDEDSRRRYFTALAHAEQASMGDRFMAGFFDTVKRHALANIVDDAERAYFVKLLEKSALDQPTAVAGETPAPPREFVRHWSLEDFSSAELDSAALIDREVTAANGEALFKAALCSRCHVLGSQGRPMGPDLTTVGRRFSPRDLLESIVEPSKVVADVHRNLIITLKDGTTVSGRIVGDDFRQSQLAIATNPFDASQSQRVAKGDIDHFETSPVSPMPPALLDTLSRGEVLDLLAWMISGAH